MTDTSIKSRYLPQLNFKDSTQINLYMSYITNRFLKTIYNDYIGNIFFKKKESTITGYIPNGFSMKQSYVMYKKQFLNSKCNLIITGWPSEVRG